MPKVKNITKASKSTKVRRCAICGHEIQVGEPYKFVAKRTGPAGGYRLIFCKDHRPRQSHLLSGRSAELAQITEGFDDSVRQLNQHDRDSLPDVVTALNDAADEIDNMAGDIMGSAESLEEGFGHPTGQSEAMTETANELGVWAELIRARATEIDSADPDDEETTPDDHISSAEEVMGEGPDLNLTG